MLDSPGFKADLHVIALQVQLFLPHILTPLSVCSCAGLFSLLKYINTAAVASGLSIVQQQWRIGSIMLGGSFQQLLIEATPVAPHYQNVATQTQQTSANTF